MVLLILHVSILFNRVSILIFPAYNKEHGVYIRKRYRLHEDMCQVTTLDRVSHFCVDIHTLRKMNFYFFSQRKQAQFLLL